MNQRQGQGQGQRGGNHGQSGNHGSQGTPQRSQHGQGQSVSSQLGGGRSTQDADDSRYVRGGSREWGQAMGNTGDYEGNQFREPNYRSGDDNQGAFGGSQQGQSSGSSQWDDVVRTTQGQGGDEHGMGGGRQGQFRGSPGRSQGGMSGQREQSSARGYGSGFAGDMGGVGGTSGGGFGMGGGSEWQAGYGQAQGGQSSRGMGQGQSGQSSSPGQSSQGQGTQSQGTQSQGRLGHKGKGPKGYKRSDERVKETVNDCLLDHDDIDAGEINVEVKDGEVTLTGTVSDRQTKRMVEQEIENLSGVNEVVNQLRVKRADQQSKSSNGGGSDEAMNSDDKSKTEPRDSYDAKL